VEATGTAKLWFEGKSRGFFVMTHLTDASSTVFGRSGSDRSSTKKRLGGVPSLGIKARTSEEPMATRFSWYATLRRVSNYGCAALRTTTTTSKRLLTIAQLTIYWNQDFNTGPKILMTRTLSGLAYRRIFSPFDNWVTRVTRRPLRRCPPTRIPFERVDRLAKQLDASDGVGV